MNASRAALMVVGVNLVAVWAAAAAGGRTVITEPAVAPQVVAEEAVGEARASMLAAAERLEAHARRIVPRAMVRDPFRFGAGAHPAGRGAASRPETEPQPGAETAVVPAVEPEPEIVLQGMAESGEGETFVRTAIVKAGADLVLASIGTRIGERYEVVAMSADSIDLQDTVAHVRRTCRMK
jgi:hypothetical protein